MLAESDGEGQSDTNAIASAVDSCIDDIVALTPATSNRTASTGTFGELGALAGEALIDSGSSPGASDDVLHLDAFLESNLPADPLEVALYAGYGTFSGGPTTPGVYQLTRDELNFATCGICVLLTSSNTGAGHDEDYMPTGGTVTITAAGSAVGGTLSGSLSNVVFRHVHIDPGGGQSTPANDICTTANHQRDVQRRPAGRTLRV